MARLRKTVNKNNYIAGIIWRNLRAVL